MSWVKVDDQMTRHPKFLRLGRNRLVCQGVWLDGMCYASSYLTDGFVPEAALDRASLSAAAHLVEVGLWQQVQGGFRIHDYHDYQPTREDVTELRRKNAERQSRHRHAATNGVTTASVIEPRPVPSRPTPVQTYEYVDPMALYTEKVGRRPGQKERDWLEDLHVRYSRTELVAAMQATPKGPDFLKRLDAFMEGRAA
jgi:hypothetical protein